MLSFRLHTVGMLAAIALVIPPTSTPLSGQAPLRVVSRKPAIDGTKVLGTIGFAKVLPDGRILLSQPQDATIMVVAADGRLLATLGRRGEGPGEFKSPVSAGAIGDTLWVFDNQLHRVSLFARNGRPLSDFKVPMLIGPVQSAALDGNGGVLGWTAFQSPGTKPRRGLVRMPQGFSSLVPLLVIPDDDCQAQPSKGATFTLPYCTRSLWGQSADGARAVLVDPVSTRYQSTGRVRVIGVTLEGDTVQNVTLGVPQVLLLAKDFDTTLDEIARRSGVPPQTARGAASKPRFLPPANWLVVDPGGGIWLGQARTEARVRWSRYSVDGVGRGYIDTPLSTRILAATVSQLLVLEPASDGSERLVWWLLDK